MRGARPITTQNPSVGLYRFATASPGHREHIALQQQSFASAWPVTILHLEGFKTCAKHGPSRHKTPLWAFTALPLPSQVTANTLPCSSSPLPAPAWPVAILDLEGFKTCAKHGPSRHKTPLWAFTALPLPSQVTANTLPCSGSPLPAPGHVAILHLEGFKTCAKHGPSRHKTRLWAFTALPLPSQVTANTFPAAAVLCQHLASAHTPFRGFQNVREARPITTQNPSVGLYRFAIAFPSHCEHVALQQQSFASACMASRHTPFRGFQNVREARPITTQNPSVGLYRFATAFPSHCKHVALQQQSFASAWPVAILHLEGFKTCAKHGPSRHKTPLWAFTALPLLSQVTANTLPCSSPLPAPGQSPCSI